MGGGLWLLRHRVRWWPLTKTSLGRVATDGRPLQCYTSCLFVHSSHPISTLTWLPFPYATSRFLDSVHSMISVVAIPYCSANRFQPYWNLSGGSGGDAWGYKASGLCGLSICEVPLRFFDDWLPRRWLMMLSFLIPKPYLQILPNLTTVRTRVNQSHVTVTWVDCFTWVKTCNATEGRKKTMVN